MCVHYMYSHKRKWMMHRQFKIILHCQLMINVYSNNWYLELWFRSTWKHRETRVNGQPLCDWFCFLNSYWIYNRNCNRITFIDFERLGNMSVWWDLCEFQCTKSKMNEGNSSLNTKLLVIDGKKWNKWSIQMHVLFSA